MVGVKVTKTLRQKGAWRWPAQYQRLDQILGAAAEMLRPYWWLLFRVGYVSPAEWLEARLETGLSGPSAARHPRDIAFEAAVDETSQPPVARPGFLPEFADIVSGDWSVLYGTAGDPRVERQVVADLATFDHWFAEPATIPAGVSAVVRGIDWAYWEVLSRDARLVDRVLQHLNGVHGLRVEPLGGRSGRRRPDQV